MIVQPSQKEPTGYRLRTFQRAIDPDDRDGALVLESLDDDMIAMAVVDVIAEATRTMSVIDQVCETIVDKPSQLKSPLQLLVSLNRLLCGTPGLGFGLPVGIKLGIQWECIEHRVGIGDTLILTGGRERVG